MPYAAFYERCPEVAERETRMLIVNNHPRLPTGNYLLLDAYCDEPGCDCRRVLLNVFREKTRTLEAVVAFGWESRKFYVKWMGDDEQRVIDALMGPALNLASPTTALSDVLLEAVKEVLKDSSYVARLKRHYQIYREFIDRESSRHESGGTVTRRAAAPEHKMGRNEACPCGSGKKYKRCCGA